MLKFYSLLIGENPAYTATFQPSSKRKIALYANCMLVPIILWFINGYLLVKDVLEGSIWTALLTATIIAFIIFLIERAVIMSNGSKWIAFFLFAFTLLLAYGFYQLIERPAMRWSKLVHYGERGVKSEK